MIRALVIEDDPDFARALQRVLEEEGFEVELARDLASARARLHGGQPDLVLLDQGLPDGSGLDLLPELARTSWRPVTLMVTGVDSSTSTIEAIRRGAYDYFVKPPELDELVAVIRRALSERELRVGLVKGVRVNEAPLDEMLVGSSRAMRQVFKAIARIAPTACNVLVTGESGTGKELVARAIHESGDRRSRPFVAVNCAALNASLIESELFGHARGAFTGAERDRPGRFELAGDGTLLLDEIGDLEPELQAKLLRTLEERTFERVGEAKARSLNARLICATHRDLRREMEAGRFREDLYFRLRVVEIHLPPLRERGSDIHKIARRLLQRVSVQLDKEHLRFTPDALDRLAQHDWPGNVRELRNVVEHAAVMARDVITRDHLSLPPPRERHEPPPADNRTRAPSSATTSSAPLATLAAMERAHIAHVLHQLGWVKKHVAETLGISRPTLDRKIRVYRLDPQHQPQPQSQ